MSGFDNYVIRKIKDMLFPEDELDSGAAFFVTAGTSIKAGQAVSVNAEGEAVPAMPPKPNWIKPKVLTPIVPSVAKFGVRPLVASMTNFNTEERWENRYDTSSGITVRVTAYRLPFRGDVTLEATVTQSELLENVDAKRVAMRKLLGELQYGIIEAEFIGMPCKHANL
jgi:hypothetical protein